MEYKKKLIEVALPLEAINEASIHESSARKGHPSSLHIWWARRPLAAARAVLFSSLVDDPSAHPELFPTEETQEKERQRLFALIEKLVIWENSNDETILNAAMAEIWKSTDGNPPALLDPFAGGGTIPLEAQRLGLKAYASDLNPVAVMVNKAMIEIPPKFAGRPPINPESRSILNSSRWSGASGLADDVRYYGEWMKQEAFKRIGHLYPTVKLPEEQGEGEANVIAWIWARTVKCPNPICGCEMPLINSYWLSKKKGKESYVVPYRSNNTVSFKVINNSPKIHEIASVTRGTKHRSEKGKVKNATFCCPICEAGIVSGEYIDKEAAAGKLGVAPVAIVSEGKRGRFYTSPDLNITNMEINNAEEYYIMNNIDSIVPHDACRGTFASNAQGRYYGFFEFKDYFTKRQLIALTTFGQLVSEAQKKVEEDAISAGMRDDKVSIDKGGVGVSAYGATVGIYLAFALDKAANYWSTLCGWRSDHEAIRETYSRHGLAMSWDFVEANPFSNSAGNFDNFIKAIPGVIELLPKTINHGEVFQHDSQSDIGLRDIMVSTDPPYYDNIGYADLSDYFYVWMRQALKDTYPKLFRTLLVPKAEELIATPYRFDGSVEKARNFFEDGMLKTFKQVYQYIRSDIPVTIYYAFKQSESDEADDGSTQTASTGWETMLSAIIQAGFKITGTWPMRTEMGTRAIAQGTNALASSIVIVCRKREEDGRFCTRRELVKELKRELKPALRELQQSNIAPVDLAQSAIGPGMAVFSRYSQVLESDGQPMSVRSALQIVNQELDLYFSEQEGMLDQNSRFCVDIYSQFAFNDLKFGEADVLARAKNTSVDRLVNEGALFAQKGVVHLLTREEIGLSGNLKNHFIWLLTQQLTYAMETGGIAACAQKISMIMDSSTENTKNLAYRLFTIAERKKWAEEAYAYNSLVVAWPDIMARVVEIKNVQPEQISIEELHN